jgi:hypothetical protein
MNSDSFPEDILALSRRASSLEEDFKADSQEVSTLEDSLALEVSTLVDSLEQEVSTLEDSPELEANTQVDSPELEANTQVDSPELEVNTREDFQVVNSPAVSPVVIPIPLNNPNPRTILSPSPSPNLLRSSLCLWKMRKKSFRLRSPPSRRTLHASASVAPASSLDSGSLEAPKPRRLSSLGVWPSSIVAAR